MQKTVIIAGYAVLFAALLACRFSLAPLPVYSMEQIPSAREGYRHTTLTSGDTVYVNDYEESALVPVNTEPHQMIGWFLLSGPGRSGLYAIPGQEPSAYVLEYDPMYQIVYRNANHPPFDWRTATFQKMRLMFITANPKDTEDSSVIENVLTTLQGQTYFAVPFQPMGNYTGYENYSLLLFTDELPGLMFSVGVHVDPGGQVYLAENMVTNRWVQAGTLFTTWMNAPE